MKPFVDIEGSGEGVTTIRGAGNPLPSGDPPTVLGANNAELRFLTVESTGGVLGFGLLADGTSPRLTHIAIRVSATVNSIPLLVWNGARVTMTDGTVTAAGAGVNAMGVHLVSASLTLRNVAITAEGRGIYSNSGSTTADGVVIDSGIEGIRLDAGSALIAERSTITAPIALAMDHPLASSAQIGASRLAGTVSITSGVVACAGVYDGSFAALGPTCF